MNRSMCMKLLLKPLFSVAVLASCSSNPPAIPPVTESPQNIQTAPATFQKALPDSQQADYFNAKVLPIVSKCQPCHFKGGKVYAQLPFDDPKTILHLGAKLFTRIRDENEQSVIRTFLAQYADSTKSSATAELRAGREQ